MRPPPKNLPRFRVLLLDTASSPDIDTVDLVGLMMRRLARLFRYEMWLV